MTRAERLARRRRRAARRRRAGLAGALLVAIVAVAGTALATHSEPTSHLGQADAALTELRTALGRIQDALDTSGDARPALADARAALDWAVAERGLDGGGFRHDAQDAAGPYLADSLAMSRALLALYRATGERAALARAARAADFIDARFRGRSGYVGASTASPIAAIATIDDNISIARHANLLSRYTGDARHRAMAKHAFAHLARRDVALSRLTDAGILIADREINRDPLHLTVVGDKRDPAAAALYAACLRVAGSYKRLDWWDRSEGPLPNPDVAYPPVKTAAAFVCTEQRCSLPIRKPEDVAAFLADSPP